MPPDRAAQRALRLSGGECEPEDLHRPSPRPPRSDDDEAAFESWLARQTERLDPLMAYLGIVFALLVAFQLADPDISEAWRRALDVSMWAIWAIFVADFVAKVVVAPRRLRFVRRHWLTVFMLLVPTLRLLRFGALLRIGRALPAARVVSSSYRATGVARQLLRSRAAFLAGVASVVMLAVAQLGWLAERDHDTFPGFEDALIWSATTVIALQGDPNPATSLGRLVMLAGFVVGLILVATLAGTVGTYLLEERRERAEREAV